MLKNIAMLGASTTRTRAYLAALREADLMPAHVILIAQPGRPVPSDLVELARLSGAQVALVEAADVNEANLVAAVRGLDQDYVIFSGPPGAIVRKPLFDTGRKFIHVHPGRLPDYRGSTTIYYSLLAENAVEATALLLDREIDGGPVIGRAVFDRPTDRRTIDSDYDPAIRALLLVSVLRDYARFGRFHAVQQTGRGETFYIVHPVLKHLAILAS